MGVYGLTAENGLRAQSTQLGPSAIEHGKGRAPVLHPALTPLRNLVHRDIERLRLIRVAGHSPLRLRLVEQDAVHARSGELRFHQRMAAAAHVELEAAPILNLRAG